MEDKLENIQEVEAVEVKTYYNDDNDLIGIDYLEDKLPEEILLKYNNLKEYYQLAIIYRLSNKKQVDLKNHLGLSKGSISRYWRSRDVEEIVRFIKLTQIREIRNEVLSLTTDGVKIALNQLTELITNAEDENTKLSAIKTMLNYDSENKSNNQITDDALKTPLLP